MRHAGEYPADECAGITGGSFHGGRRSFILTLAGHKHLSTTQRSVDVNDELLRQAVELA